MCLQCTKRVNLAIIHALHLNKPKLSRWVKWKSKVLVIQSCLTLCNPMGCSPPGSLVHGVLQARIQEWVAIPFSRRSSWPRDQTWVSCTAGRFFTIWATREVHHNWQQRYKLNRWNRGLLSAAYKIPVLLLLLLFIHGLSSTGSLPTTKEITQVGTFLPAFPVSIWGSSELTWGFICLLFHLGSCLPRSPVLITYHYHNSSRLFLEAQYHVLISYLHLQGWSCRCLSLQKSPEVSANQDGSPKQQKLICRRVPGSGSVSLQLYLLIFMRSCLIPKLSW